MCHFIVKVCYAALSLATYLLYGRDAYYGHGLWLSGFCSGVFGGIMVNGFGLLISFLFHQRSFLMETVWSITGAVLYPVAGAWVVVHEFFNQSWFASVMVDYDFAIVAGMSLACSILLGIDASYNIKEWKWAREDEAYQQK